MTDLSVPTFSSCFCSASFETPYNQFPIEPYHIVRLENY
jgi:hypothetical protein